MKEIHSISDICVVLVRMHQVKYVSSAIPITSTESPLKTELNNNQEILTPTSISLTESSVTPSSVTQAQVIAVPLVSSQRVFKTTSSSILKRAKRVCISHYSYKTV